MSIQPDSWIKKMCKEHNMIEPFLDHQVAEGKISYGLSSMGYDVRISDEYRIFTNVNNSLVDPKNFSDDNFIEKKGPHCIIPPNSFVLAKTNEFGGIMQCGPFFSIKLSSEKFFGSTKELFTLVNILYSSEILTS